MSTVNGNIDRWASSLEKFMMHGNVRKRWPRNKNTRTVPDLPSSFSTYLFPLELFCIMFNVSRENKKI